MSNFWLDLLAYLALIASCLASVVCGLVMAYRWYRRDASDADFLGQVWYDRLKNTQSFALTIPRFLWAHASWFALAAGAGFVAAMSKLPPESTFSLVNVRGFASLAVFLSAGYVLGPLARFFRIDADEIILALCKSLFSRLAVLLWPLGSLAVGASLAGLYWLVGSNPSWPSFSLAAIAAIAGGLYVITRDKVMLMKSLEALSRRRIGERNGKNYLPHAKAACVAVPFLSAYYCLVGTAS